MAAVLQRLIKEYLCLLLCTMNSNSALMTIIWVITRSRIISVPQHATAIFGMTDLQIDTEATGRSNMIRQYTNNITLWHIHVTILVMKTQQYIPLVWLLAQR